MHLARGQLRVNGQRLKAGDGLALRKVQRLDIDQGKGAEVLVFDLRPEALPGG